VFNEATRGRSTTLGGVIATGVTFDGLFGSAGKGQSGLPRGCTRKELLAPTSNADHLKDVADTGLCLDQSIKQIREVGRLSDSRSRPSLAKVRVIHAKSFG
jgi:hypothetical protein